MLTSGFVRHRDERSNEAIKYTNKGWFASLRSQWQALLTA